MAGTFSISESSGRRCIVLYDRLRLELEKITFVSYFSWMSMPPRFDRNKIAPGAVKCRFAGWNSLTQQDNPLDFLNNLCAVVSA